MSAPTEEDFAYVPGEWRAVELSAMPERLEAALAEAEAKAWDALGRYKFVMFGYWAGVWVHLNRVRGGALPNPFASAVLLARSRARAGSYAPPDVADIPAADRKVCP